MKNSEVEAIALSVRSLSMDAVEKANSGHPGLPMGLAELGAVLFGEILKYDPAEPAWPNRDRFVLSAGHGSMFLYSLLYLAGYDLPMEQLTHFRQVGYRTPGHPEYGHTVGVETTTGPLGQGISNAVGMAAAYEMSAARFNTPEHTILDHYVYCIVSDGDLMEGVASESCSLAGHLGLGRLIVFYDDNRISIEGSTELAFTEDARKRFDAYGWQVLSGDAYDWEGIVGMVEEAKRETSRPTLIALRSVIGKGSPNKAGTAEVHGAALGPDELVATKKNLGLEPDAHFFVHPDAVAFFAERRKTLAKRHEEWKSTFESWKRANPELRTRWEQFHESGPPALSSVKLPEFEPGEKLATRKASGKVLAALAEEIPNLVGGSADLAPSNNTAMPAHGDFSRENRLGRTLHFGVREHGMSAICNGIYLYGGYRPFGATFLVFTDYMRGSMRLAALTGIPVIYVMTHDSIYLGEDGPTHQPVEQLAALRAIPNMRVLRPGDAQETAEAWLMALEHTGGPTVLALTRQGIAVYEKADPEWAQNVRRGAYVVRDVEGEPEVAILATGSEVSLALEAAEACGRRSRVVSVISRELFLEQGESYRKSLIPGSTPVVVVEAGVSQGWEQFVADATGLFTIDTFGASGPGKDVAAQLGFTAENLARVIESSCRSPLGAHSA